MSRFATKILKIRRDYFSDNVIFRACVSRNVVLMFVRNAPQGQENGVTNEGEGARLGGVSSSQRWISRWQVIGAELNP